MELLTHVERPSYDFTCSHSDRLLSIGSCFAERTASMLEQRQFAIQGNPLGVVYNPVSVRQTLDFLRTQHRFTPEQTFFHQHAWHGYHFNRAFSHPDRSQVLERANRRIREVDPRQTTRLLITLGTARAYEHRATGITVANNHRLPARDFRPYRIDLAAERAHWKTALDAYRAQTNHPESFRVLLTVSPVRHRQEGYVANQRSKAVLHLLCESLCAELPYVHYFPAYEIVMDELRDYRFYGPDLLHPGENATAYIHEIFTATFFDPTTRSITDQIDALQRAARHRPHHKFGVAHRDFLRAQLQKLDTLRVRFPGVQWRGLADHFRRELQLVQDHLDGEQPGGLSVGIEE